MSSPNDAADHDDLREDAPVNGMPPPYITPEVVDQNTSRELANENAGLHNTAADDAESDTHSDDDDLIGSFRKAGYIFPDGRVFECLLDDGQLDWSLPPSDIQEVWESMSGMYDAMCKLRAEGLPQKFIDARDALGKGNAQLGESTELADFLEMWRGQLEQFHEENFAEFQEAESHEIEAACKNIKKAYDVLLCGTGRNKMAFATMTSVCEALTALLNDMPTGERKDGFGTILEKIQHTTGKLESRADTSRAIEFYRQAGALLHPMPVGVFFPPIGHCIRAAIRLLIEFNNHEMGV